MTRVDFYILAAQQVEQQWQFCARLIDKAVRNGNQILVQLDNEQEAKAFDDYLWTFRPNAFIPHTLLSDEKAKECAVNIGWGGDCGHQHDVLINLSQDLPEFHARFQRLIEVVIQQDQTLNYTRRHYKYLQERGYPIQHTDMRMR